MSPRRQDGTAPLWIASQMGHSEVVRVMLLRGADRDAARNVSLSQSWGAGEECMHRSSKIQPNLDVQRKRAFIWSLTPLGFLPPSSSSVAGKQGKCLNQLNRRKCCPVSLRERCVILPDPPPPELTPG